VDKTRIDKNAIPYPMPVVILGAVVDGKPNFMAVAWVTRVNYQPPLIAVACGHAHHTHRGIEAHKEFSISVPGRDVMVATDHVGLVSGAKQDKSGVFESFKGELEFAPMVRACPVTLECRLVQSVALPADTLFVGEIVGAYSEERFLTGGRPDISKIHPFMLTMPDNHYWGVGEELGKAWSVGKEYHGS
jgi:flavin reductase (DIM6/NTAB) family NADH-FMN oxidoreductase RutF